MFKNHDYQKCPSALQFQSQLPWFNDALSVFVNVPTIPKPVKKESVR